MADTWVLRNQGYFREASETLSQLHHRLNWLAQAQPVFGAFYAQRIRQRESFPELLPIGRCLAALLPEFRHRAVSDRECVMTGMPHP